MHYTTPPRPTSGPGHRLLVRALRLLGLLILLWSSAAAAGTLLRPAIARADEGHPPAPTQTTAPDGHADTDTEHTMSAPRPADSGHDDNHAAPHGHPADPGHDTNEPTDDHDADTGTHAEDEAAHGHGEEAPGMSTQTKSMVLGGFAGANGLVMLVAAILRRRNPPRLPKHLQR